MRLFRGFKIAHVGKSLGVTLQLDNEDGFRETESFVLPAGWAMIFAGALLKESSGVTSDVIQKTMKRLGIGAR